jgi:YebC/PmpR family DNA-binding regulatory protein
MGRAFEYRKERIFKRNASNSKIFTKISKDIAMAVKSSGPDPEANGKLRVLIQNAKAANMPKDTVDRAIKRASSKDQEDYKEVIYEGYAPHGVAVLVETATDNSTRTVSNVRSVFSKFGGSLGNSGSVAFMFEHKCNFKVKAKPGVDLEELELELIDFGVSDVFAEEDNIIIYGEFESFGGIQKFLEEKGFELVSAEFEWIPTDTKELTPEQVASVDKLIEKLEIDDDVTNVFTNMR